jgi:hypothetical protein
MTVKGTKLVLTGGLGNQLFQIGAALALVPENPIICDWILGKPRLNIFEKPEISSYSLPKQILIDEKKDFSKIASKAIGFQLRKGISPRLIERIPGFDFTTKLLGLAVTLKYFREFRWSVVCRGVGYSEIKTPNRFSLLIGYFQSYKWVSEPRVREAMKSIKLINPNSDLTVFRTLAREEKPLIVHIRLGDYVGHDTFGIPSQNYFISSIHEVMNLGISRKVWLFSDEPAKAIDFLKDFDSNLIRVVPEIDRSASSTLEVMRLGSAYVISNSTFSWWGAFLSHTENPVVITPAPWFKFQEEPKDFIPKEWQRRNAGFE